MHCGAAPAARTHRPRLELADIIREHGAELDGLLPDQCRVLSALVRCRTVALGGHVHQCDRCGHREISYNSCRDRHCPKCQGLDEARWIEARVRDLLPVEYFHVVFTIPSELGRLFLANRRAACNLLFSAVSETLIEVARNPANLGARIGFTSILHTWTQQLLYHPHVHCIVPGGGLSQDGSSWISAKAGFFLPIRILSKVFRGKLLSKLQGAAAAGEIRLPKSEDVAVLLRTSARQEWVVYAKAPFAGPQQVLRYLGRYTHRIAVSNHRLVSLNDGRLTFRWKDRTDGDQQKLMTLDAAAFLKRFLLHVLPRGLVRIRHYGLLANPVRRKLVRRCRELLDSDTADEVPPSESWDQLLLRLTGVDVTQCPRCRQGHLVVIEELRPLRVCGGWP